MVRAPTGSTPACVAGCVSEIKTESCLQRVPVHQLYEVFKFLIRNFVEFGKFFQKRSLVL